MPPVTRVGRGAGEARQPNSPPGHFIQILGETNEYWRFEHEIVQAARNLDEMTGRAGGRDGGVSLGRGAIVEF